MPRAPAKPPTRIFLVRHGQTVSNREGRFCGHSETPLTELGLAQAAALASRMRGIPIAAAYTSDFSRAIDTAAIVLAGRGLTPQTDPGFRELHYGDWEMKKQWEISRRDRAIYGQMRAEDPAWQPPGGETIGIVRERTMAALTRVAAAHPHQNVLVVAHGTAINCLLTGVLGMAPEYTFRVDIANCGLTELVVHNRRITVACLNDTSHLSGVGPAG